MQRPMPSPSSVNKAPQAVRVGHEGRPEGEGWAARGACAVEAQTPLGWADAQRFHQPEG